LDLIYKRKKFKNMAYSNLLGQIRVGVRPVVQQTIQASLVTSGLILHLDSGNSSSYSGSGTTWVDLSGNNRNATLINGPQYSSVDGGKIVFDGTNDYAEFSNPPVLGSGDFAIEVWFKRKTSTLSWDDTYLFSKWYTGASPGSNEWAVIFADSTGTSNGNNLIFSFELSTGGAYGVISDEILINTWYQSVVVREGGVIKIYINGSLRTTDTPSIPSYGLLGNKSINNVGRKMRIARQDNIDNLYSNVEVPIIRMYNRSLNATEVAQNYLNNKSRFGMVDNPQILNNLILDVNPALYVSGSPTLLNPANVGNNIKVWGNETDSTSAPVWNRRWFTFDGVNDYLEIKDAKPFMFGTQSFTVGYWYKIRNDNFGWSGPAFNKWFTGANPGSNNWSLGIADYNVFRPGLSIDSNGTFYSVSSPETLSINTWYHVVGVRDGGTLKIYVNGVLKGTNSPAGFATRSISSTSQPLYIGKIGAGSNANQDAGRAQIYNRALTDAEILSLYNSQKTDFIITNGLQYYIDAWIPSSGSAGGPGNILDISGNGRSGTLANGAYYNSGTASVGGSFVFDGVNDYIQTNYNHNLAAGANFTANVWANGRSYSASGNSLVVSNYNGTPGPYNLYILNSGKFLGWTRDNNDNLISISSTTTITDKWCYLTYRKQGNTFSLFVNGVLEASTTANLGAITPNNNIVIGQQNTYFGQPYLGRIGEVHLYNVALSDSEILHNFTSTRSRYGI
jgi:hypothetical protein